jgi:hypothetical protein
MFSGGISNVTRQYDGKRRSSRICSVVGAALARVAVQAFWQPLNASKLLQ